MMNTNLDLDFLPAYLSFKDFQSRVLNSNHYQLLHIAIRRNNQQIYRNQMYVYEDNLHDEENIFMAERFIKTILWIVGGYEIYLCGSHTIYQAIHSFYQNKGYRDFDYHFMSNVYEHDFQVFECTLEKLPECKQYPIQTQQKSKGKRIGLDAGGSDIKITALKDGKIVYSEEIIWHPKVNSDPAYHTKCLYEVLKKGIHALGDEIDAIGVSSAGIYIDNKTMVASLYIKIAKKDFDQYIKNIYPSLIHKLEKEYGHSISFCLANDGDVTAFTGYLSYGKRNILGIAMGTSEAGGFINEEGMLLGWLNELAFVPIAFNKNARRDDWSKDFGVGARYLSQDCVIDLANKVGIVFEEISTPAEKLAYVQDLLDKQDKGAECIFETIGMYFGYAIAYYHLFYPIDMVLLLGRVVSKRGGDIIAKKAKEILYSKEINLKQIEICLPNEDKRRVGQSQAASYLA